MENIKERAKKEATELVNKIILPQMSLHDYGAGAFFEINPVKIRNMLMEYILSGDATPKPWKIVVDRGALIINDNFIGRIAPLPTSNWGDGEKAGFYEGKILARQENLADE